MLSILGLNQLYHLEWVFSFWKGTNRYFYIFIFLWRCQKPNHASSPLLLARAWSRVDCTKYLWKVLIRMNRLGTFSDNRLLPQTFFSTNNLHCYTSPTFCTSLHIVQVKLKLCVTVLRLVNTIQNQKIFKVSYPIRN